MDEKILKERIKALPQTDDRKESYVIEARMKNKRAYITWNEDEDKLLTDMFQTKYSVSFMAKKLDRSNKSIEDRIKALGLSDQRINEKELVKDEKLSDVTPELNLIRYWRNSLADMDKMGLSPKQMKQGENFSLESFQGGELLSAKIERFFREAEKYLKEKNKKRSNSNNQSKINEDESTRINVLPVIIAPFTAVRIYEHGKKNNSNSNQDEVFPLWLVAKLTRKGELVPDNDTNTLPWLDRRCLTPNEEISHFPIIGDVSEVDKFYTQERDLSDKGNITWEKLFSWSLNLFKTIERTLRKLLSK